MSEDTLTEPEVKDSN